jgi:hypothetical protein
MQEILRKAFQEMELKDLLVQNASRSFSEQSKKDEEDIGLF